MTSSVPTIREVEPRDVPEVVAHVREILAEFGIAFGIGASSDAELEHLPDSYRSKDGAFWVARGADENVLGTAGIVRISPNAFELRKMYLRPESRGVGLGKALLAKAIAHAKAHGARMIVLDTVEQMRDAIAFYERHGFVRDDAQIRAPRCTRGYRLEL